MPIIKKPFTLAPLNDNPAVLSGNATDTLDCKGGFSHKGGFPTIKFSMPPQPVMLEMGSLKLTGQFLIKNPDGTVVSAINNNADMANGITGANGVGGNIEIDGTGAATSCANAIPQTMCNLPNWGGVQNTIDKVVVQSKKSLIELTSVNNYGQYSGMTECYNNNEDDYIFSPLTKGLAGGTHAGKVNRRLTACSTNVATTGCSSITGGATDKVIGQFFSIPIKIDLLGGQNLFLDDDYLGGLLLTIHLAPDSAVFSNRHNNVLGTSAAPNDMSGRNYVLKNIRLEGRYIVPDQQDLANVPPVLSLDSRLNLINDIHSSVNANAYTPQLQSVKSVVSVFMDNDQTNTFTKNQNNFRRIPGEKSNQQARNGLRFPYNFETFIKPNMESTVENGAGNTGEKNLFFPALQYGDSEVRKQFEASLLNGGKPYHSSASLKLTNDRLKEDISADAANDECRDDNCVADCVGIGADYTLGLGMTQNFVNQDYNLTTRSGVNTANSKIAKRRNGEVSANPMLEQSFIRYNSQFDTQSLVKVI